MLSYLDFKILYWCYLVLMFVAICFGWILYLLKKMLVRLVSIYNMIEVLFNFIYFVFSFIIVLILRDDIKLS
jgi:drug/metabolite transporter (DMT)-like permease